MAAQGYRTKSIDLTREQLFAILRDTDGGPVEIRRTKGAYIHTYACDESLKAEGRVLHVAKNGNTTECEGPRG